MKTNNHAAFIFSISDDGSDVNAYDCHGVRKVFTKRYFFTVKGLCAINTYEKFFFRSKHFDYDETNTDKSKNRKIS